MVFFLTKKLLDEKNLLSKIWLAAHWDKKLNKYQIYSINIENTVKQIMSEEIVLDLRISGHLLFGIVRIFSRKTMYLLNECSSIFSRVKIYQTGLIDLPEPKRKLPLLSATLPDKFEHFNDFNGERLDELLSSHQSRTEDITLKETYHNIHLIDEEFDERFFIEMNQGTFDDNEEDANLLKLLQNDEAERNGINCNGVNTKDASSDEMETEGVNGIEPYHEISDEHIDGRIATHISESGDLILIHEATHHAKKSKMTELLLEPLPISFKSADRLKRKRKLIIDEVKMLDEEKLQNQLRDTEDITVPLDLAPPSKRLMTLKRIGGTRSLLHLPGLNLNSTQLLRVYQRHLRPPKKEENEHESSGEESAYGSIGKHPHNSDDLFPEESIENERSNNLGIHEFSLNEGEANMNSDPESSVDAGVDCDFHEPLSQPINFSDEIQLEMSLSHNKDGEIYNLHNKIVIFLKYIGGILKSDDSSIKFSLLVQSDKKIKVSRKFLFLLMLKKFQIVELQQEKPYDEIIISRGVNFVSAFTELCLN
ncbi:double-strand-break repair protein rad21 homolog isoform X1 [Parasteatoda tepidariorum]|uniref:double-strand-break repair protein rad21 homolog isoform X1 n=1 Tax=Parasteatoda tepidariorum TaxID=114398 RepID=UPI00077FB97F|nr:double-strand-break repair protein rad21-like protein 1 [Parasteatoda tepidariorum]